MVNEYEHLRDLCSQNPFWGNDLHGGYVKMVGTGLRMRIVGSSVPYSWAVEWPDGTVSVAERSFDSVADAKNDLKQAVQSRLYKMAAANARRLE